MTAYSSSLTFATEAGVERYAVYDLTSSSVPTDDQGYEYAKDVTATIVMQTEKAGSKTTPPHTSDATGLSRLLQAANEVGAAFLVRMHMFTLNGDEASLRVAERLASLWASYMGEDSVKGGCLCAGTGGAIFEAIASASDSRVLANDVTAGQVSLKSLDIIQDIEPPFTMSSVD